MWWWMPARLFVTFFAKEKTFRDNFQQRACQPSCHIMLWLTYGRPGGVLRLVAKYEVCHLDQKSEHKQKIVLQQLLHSLIHHSFCLFSGWMHRILRSKYDELVIASKERVVLLHCFFHHFNWHLRYTSRFYIRRICQWGITNCSEY